MRSLQVILVTVAIGAVASASRAEILITQGGTWDVVARVKATACALGRCVSDHDSAEQQAYLPAGSSIQVTLQIWDCSDVALEDYCSLVPRKRKTKLRDCDKTLLAEILRSCSPYDNLRLRRVGGFEQAAPDGTSFRWKSAVGFGLRTQGVNVAVHVGVVVEGTWLSEAAVAPVPEEADLIGVSARTQRLVDDAVAAALADRPPL